MIILGVLNRRPRHGDAGRDSHRRRCRRAIIRCRPRAYSGDPIAARQADCRPATTEEKGPERGRTCGVGGCAKDPSRGTPRIVMMSRENAHHSELRLLPAPRSGWSSTARTESRQPHPCASTVPCPSRAGEGFGPMTRPNRPSGTVGTPNDGGASNDRS